MSVSITANSQRIPRSLAKGALSGRVVNFGVVEFTSQVVRDQRPIAIKIKVFARDGQWSPNTQREDPITQDTAPLEPCLRNLLSCCQVGGDIVSMRVCIFGKPYSDTNPVRVDLPIMVIWGVGQK
jgi:hypothetical protein